MFNLKILFILNLIIFLNINNIKCTTANSKYNQYLLYIFNKYGNGETMSFEGLEHLMHSLGIGDLQFNPNHTIDQHHPIGYKMPNLIEINSIENSTDTDTDFKTINENTRNLTKLSFDKLNQQEENAKLKKDLTNEDDVKENAKLKKDRTNEDDFQENDTLFKEMHDPKHRHRRHHDVNDKNICLSPEATLRLVINDNIYNLNDDKRHLYRNKRNSHISDEDKFHEYINKFKITQDIFMKICPALLVQIDQNLCPKELNNRPIIEDLEEKTNGLFYAAIYASVALFILSSCGLFGILIVPLMKTIAYQETLKFLVAVAVGTLIGDALMHLLPHAVLSLEHSNGSEHDQNAEQNLVLIMACTFGVILFMYCLEHLVPLIKGNSGHGHSHQHNTSAMTGKNEVKEINTMLDDQKIDKKKPAPITPVAFMVILGDGLHNLTDGLAIGAAFAADPVTGMATAFAVLCHELPHELGDFALLLQTGMSLKRAIYLNIISSVLSFMGMAFGLVITSVHAEMVRWIYSATAGSFLYIALSDLVPEMNKSEKNNFKNVFIQIFGILIGGLIMLWIALKEDQLRVLFE